MKDIWIESLNEKKGAGKQVRLAGGRLTKLIGDPTCSHHLD
jgi:hypothetical protein